MMPFIPAGWRLSVDFGNERYDLAFDTLLDPSSRCDSITTRNLDEDLAEPTAYRFINDFMIRRPASSTAFLGIAD